MSCKSTLCFFGLLLIPLNLSINRQSLTVLKREFYGYVFVGVSSVTGT